LPGPIDRRAPKSTRNVSLVSLTGLLARWLEFQPIL
jgi:hypothetical protein